MKHFVWVVFMSISLPLWGQMEIDVNYDSTRLEEVINDLESRYDLKFFYAQSWIDTVVVKVEKQTLSLDNFLRKALDNTSLFFFIERDNRIILTKDYRVISNFPKSKEEQKDIDLAIFDEKVESSNEIDLSNPENLTYSIGNPQKKNQGRRANLYGYVRDEKTGEVLVGVTVYSEEEKVGTLTDDFGYYVLDLPKGEHTIQFRYVGKKDTYRKIKLNSDGNLDAEMENNIISLKEVEITGERSNVETVQTGVVKINIADLEVIPTVLGEADVMKITLTLPGVQTVGEGASGFNVRGGTTAQNLISLDDGIIYNPSHLFGFFSAFNPDLIKSAELYKSGIQARYGGRVSSIFDVSIRDGNKKRTSLSGGIGPVTSKLTLEGPIKKDEGSFILGARSTYSDWILNLLDDPGLASSNAFFGDLVGKINYQLGDKNSISIAGYHSRDLFRLGSDTLYQYQNTNASIRFRHIFNSKFSGLFSGSYTGYGYDISSEENPQLAFDLDYQMNQASFKADFDYFPNDKHSLRFGWQSHYYLLNPGAISPRTDTSVVGAISLNQETGAETALYIGDEFEINSRLTVYGGLRWSVYALLGPGDVYNYRPGRALDVDFITDTTSYQSGDIIKTYGGPEFRFSGRYKLNETLSLKASYDKTRQYIHMLTNTVAISPTDTWRLSNTYLRPEIGDQFTLGLYQNWPNKGLEFSVESYYKSLKNLLEYKNGANLLINETLETDVINARGRAFGIEFLLKKKSGKLNGWVSYAFSRALVQAAGDYPEEIINRGEFYPSNFDRPHNISIITNYKFTRRINISLNTTYSTGRPATLPVATYRFNNVFLPYFSDRNQYRIPDYFRMDLAVNVEGNHKVRKFLHSSWSFSIYNLTGRNNAYSVFSQIRRGKVQTYQLSIFSRAIPTFTYNFELR